MANVMRRRERRVERPFIKGVDHHGCFDGDSENSTFSFDFFADAVEFLGFKEVGMSDKDKGMEGVERDSRRNLGIRISYRVLLVVARSMLFFLG